MKLILISLAVLVCSYKAPKTILVIQHVNFFDGEDYQTNVNVIVEDQLIVDITTENNWPAYSTVINGKDRTIIPPLLNAHVHLSGKNQLKEAVRSGVFALLDMHTTDPVAIELRQYRNKEGYAFYYSSGPGVTVPGGHGTQFGVVVPVLDSLVSPKQFVQDRVANHADYIKILREPYMTTINFVQTQQVIDASHENSLLCVAHISRLDDAMVLAKQKIDGFMHIWHDRKISKEELDSLFNSNVFIVPTLLVTQKLLGKVKSPEFLKKLLSFEMILEETQKAYASGIPILAGSDAPNHQINFGDDLIKELTLLRKAGLPTIEVLKSATSNIYKSFQLKDFGKLKKGAPANFLLIRGNPVENIEDLIKIESIWQNGKRQ